METVLDRVRRFPRRALRNIFIRMRSIDELCKDSIKQSFIDSCYIHTPEVEDMNFFPKSKSLKNSLYCFPGSYTIKLNNVIYHTNDGTLTTPSRVILSESINGWKEKQKFSIRETYFSQPKYLSRESLYSVFRSTNNGYYHTIIDNLPRLYSLSRLEGSSIKLLFPGNPTRIEKFFLDRLLSTNIDIEHVKPNESYFIREIIFPSFVTRPFSGYLPSEYLAYFKNRVLPKRPRRKINRILITRGPNSRNSRRQRRRFLNEDILVEKLEKYGFKSYCLENMSIEEQIDLFYDAEFVVGAHGAGLTNTIFSENIGVLELFPSNYVLPYYYYLAKSLGHKYLYLYGDRNSIHADFPADSNKIIQLLENCGL
jgi:hypothetical protein